MFRLGATRHWLTGLTFLLASQAHGEPPAGGAKPIPADRHGDPLPDGAIARLGTVRWRQPRGVSSVAFSPDGKTLAAGGGAADGGISLWEVATGKEGRRLPGHKHAVEALVFSPDGKALASAGLDGVVRLWEVASGRELHKFPANARALAFSPDGKTLAWAVLRGRPAPGGAKGAREYDSVIHLHEVGTGKEVRRLEPPGGVVRALAFSPDGKTLAAGHMDDEVAGRPKPEGKAGAAIRLWAVATGKESAAWGAGRRDVRSLAFSPDGKVLAAGHYDKTVRLWGVGAGKELRRLKAGARPGRSAEELGQLGRGVLVAFTDGGKTLVSACEDRTVLVWDAGTGKELRQLPDQYPEAIALSRDGRLVVVGGGTTNLRLWKVGAGKAADPPEGHSTVVRAVAFSPDGKTLASAGGDIRLWEPATGKELRRLPGSVAVAFSPDGKTLACGGRDHSLRLHAAATGKVLHRFRSSHSGFTYPAAVAFSPDGKLVAAESDRVTGLWEVATGKESPLVTREDLSKGFKHGLRSGVNALAFSPDGNTLAWAAAHSQICLWQLAPEKAYRGLDHVGARSVAFSPDGQLLAAAGGSHARRREALGVCLWEVATGRECRRMAGAPHDLRAVAFAPDGKSLAGGGGDGTVRLWEVATGQQRHQFRGHGGPVWCVAFSPDGRAVASGSEDTTALLWEVAGGRDRGRGVRLPAKRLGALWAELSDADAAKAFGAMRALAAAPADAVPFLRDQLRKALKGKGEQITRRITDLDDDDFAVREKATAELEKLGALAEPALRRALARGPSAEVRRRAGRLLGKVKDSVPPPETLRLLRAVEVLEQVGTPEAGRVLGELAEGVPVTRAAAEAKEAVQRLTRRAKPLP